MQEPSAENGPSRYLVSPLRTLFEVCRAAGRDDNGRACAECPVRDICDAERHRAAMRAASAGDPSR